MMLSISNYTIHQKFNYYYQLSYNCLQLFLDYPILNSFKNIKENIIECLVLLQHSLIDSLIFVYLYPKSYK